MKSYDELLSTILRAEKVSGLYEAEIMGVPLWRLVRFEARDLYVSRRSKRNNNTHERKVRVAWIIKGFLISSWKLWLLLIRRRKAKYLVIAFPRLVKLGDVFLDKFTDPVIELTNLQGNCTVLQRNLSGRHFYPRYGSEHVVESDAIDYTANVFGMVLAPFFFLIYAGRLVQTFGKAKDFFELDWPFLFKMSRNVGIFVFQYFMMLGLLKATRPQKLFLVNRGTFKASAAAARRVGISVLELQHGVTQSESILYSGDYDPAIDPDYFLIFGAAWRGPQFGMPEKRIKNIGWAYSTFTRDYRDLEQYSDRHVLVVSAPSVTSMIYELVEELSEQYPNYVFHLRLHPQEGLAEHQLLKLRSIPNVLLDNRELDSALAVSRYSRIIGENSSVLYEGLAMGRRVGRLNLRGFHAKQVAGIEEEGFEYLHNMSDLERFLNVDDRVRETSRLRAYDSFNASLVNELLKEK